MKTQRFHQSQGFTLLELMLSLAILALISLGIASGLTAGIRAWESGERNLSKYQRKRIVCERLYREIGGALNLKGKLEDEEQAKMIFRGETDSLTFITTAGAMISPGLPMALKESSIYVAPGSGLVIRESMFSRSDFFDQNRGQEYILDPDVTALKFRYYYVPKAARIISDEPIEGEWLSTWGPDHLEIEETVVEEEDQMKEIRDREIKMNLPVCVEVIVMVTEPDTGASEEWAPIMIPLKESRTLGVSARRR